MQNRLNGFQKSMLQWDEMHPYSAVHVVRIRGVLEEDRLRRQIHSVVSSRELSPLRREGEGFVFQPEAKAADVEFRTLAGTQNPVEALTTEIERQLNLRFDCTGVFSPFRFLVVPAGDGFYLGLAYFHPVADAESVVWLLKDIVTAYLEDDREHTGAGRNANSSQTAPALSRYPTAVFRKLLTLPGQIRNLRQSCRARYRDPDNMTNGFSSFTLGPGDFQALVATSRSWEVTINDLLMALLFKGVSPYAGQRAQARKRRKLSLGCIVNVRKDMGLDDPRAFGVFLGSFVVTHPVPEGGSLRELAQDIRQQTARVKRHKLYLATSVELGFARFALRFFSDRRRRRVYGKHYPLWGGITNLNLNRLWEPSDRHPPLDYFRGVSTGPVTPLVLSVTTIGERVNLGVSYRTTAFSRQEIDDLCSRFQDPLKASRQTL